MMEAVGLKNRPNFMDYSLTPAIREGFVCKKQMACNSLSYTPFDSVLLCLYLCVSFDLLEVGILNVVVLRGLLAVGLLVVEGTLLLVGAGLGTSLLVHLL